MERTLRIVFMGTPEFAVASLEALVHSRHRVVAVVTAADAPAGRGLELRQSAVKQCALQHGIPVLQPVKLKDPDFATSLQSYKADLFVVVAFRMLPESIWTMPPLGTINLHGSLLPRYRGAAPIQWAVLNGDKETGVTTFFLRHEIDTGHVIRQQSMPIGDDETTGEVYSRMMAMGAGVLVDTVNRIADGTAQAVPQDVLLQQGHALLHAPKIFKEDARIDWRRGAAQVHNLVRGMNPSPGAFTEWQGKQLKVYKGRPVVGIGHLPPGEWETDRKTYLRFGCVDGVYELLEVQAEGKKRMGVDEFLRGQRWI